MTPRQILEPLAYALVTMFYRMVQRTSDTQTRAEWTYSDTEISAVPQGYTARLKLDLIHTETRKSVVQADGADERKE